MRRVVAAALLALSPAGGATAADSGSIGAHVLPNPLELSLALSQEEIAVGGALTATATVRNVGTTTLENVVVSLPVDPGLVVSHGTTRALAPLAGNSRSQVAFPLCAIAAGSYVVMATASGGGFASDSEAHLLQVSSSPGTCSEDASAAVSAGGTLSTDGEGDGATAADPIETAVTSPNAGTVSLDESPAGADAPSGLAVLGWTVQISAPSATAANPLRIRFELDATLLSGVDAATVQVFRDRLAVPACPGDPCVESRTLESDGDLDLVVLTSAASAWTFGTVYPFSGFFQPVDNPPALNAVNAGRAVPVKFSLGGDRGLAILAVGYPASQRVACDTSSLLHEVEETVTTSGSDLSYDAATGQYAYVWKTDPAWAGTCRRLIVRLVDGTDHRANFKLR